MTRLILMAAIAVAAWAQPAHELALNARAAALDRADWKKAQSLIDSAIKRWNRDREPHDADYARALDLAGMLARHRNADLAAVVEPLFREALDIIEHDGSGASEADVAAALELEALALADLARPQDAAPLKERALKIRAEIVGVMDAAFPSPPRGAAASRIGKGVKPPALIHKQDPEYNNFARLVKVQGKVVLRLVIGEDGLPRDFHLVRSLGFGLDEEAFRVVKAWRFRPGYRDEAAVAVEVTIEVNYNLL